MYIIGWIIVIFGTLITAFTYLSDSKVIIIAFGLVVFGIKQVIQGRSQMSSYNIHRQRMSSRRRRF
jgi:hypothetical protein